LLNSEENATPLHVDARQQHGQYNQLPTRKYMTRTTKKNQGSALVYSTETGRICPDCSQPIAQCVCRSPQIAPSADGVVRISLETKGRRGKGVTVIKGVPLDPLALAALAKKLKAVCGSGGTAKDGVIEIQGDHRENVMRHLASTGWAIKRA
jgi:translation initiation factor 1